MKIKSVEGFVELPKVFLVELFLEFSGSYILQVYNIFGNASGRIMIENIIYNQVM